MNSFYLKQFEEKFGELIEDLSKKYNDKIEIEVYKRSLNKLDYTKIAKHFANKLQPYSKLVAATDESLFNIENLEFIEQINFSEIWKDDLTEADKKSLWQYIQVLYLLSNIIIDENVDSTKKKENEENGEETSNSEKEQTGGNEENSEKIPENTINQMIKTMKDNIESNNMNELNLNNISKKQIDEATSEVQNKFSSTGSNNVMEDMISEINKELTNMVDNKNSGKGNSDDGASNIFESNPQLDMMSQMLNIDKNGLGGIMNIANKVSQKFQSRVENGDLDPAQLMSSAQSMLMGLQNMK